MNEHTENMEPQVNRTNWTHGPWDYEPNRVDFEREGYPCLILRGRLGNLCGYVGIPPGHPLYGKHYAELYTDDDGPEVHGSLTYADKCDPPICHVPKPGEPDNLWWFGFDCAHCWDTMPYRGMSIGPSTYKDVPFVKKECGKLAKWLREHE